MNSSDNLVEAIEEGRIVRVPESYAKREGLIVLKRPEIAERASSNPPSTAPSSHRKNDLSRTKPFTHIIDQRPGWQEKQVISELVDNFQWQIKFERRKKGLTRKQFAKIINEPEENIQIIEAGRLPSPDFILINKIQKALNLNLRKDQKDFSLTTKDMLSQQKDVPEKKKDYRNLKDKGKDKGDLLGEGIEILDDEI